MPLFGSASGLTIAAVLAALNPTPTVATGVSGTRALAFAAGALNTQFDLTMSGATSITLDPSLAVPGATLTVTFKGAYAWSFTNTGLAYQGRIIPTPQCSATLYDTVIIVVQPDGTLLAQPSLGNGAAYLSVNAPSGTVYAGQSVTLTGAYFGLTPTNLDVSISGGAFGTVSPGTTTITNGTFSLPITAPATGAATVQVRATNTGIVSPVTNFTVSAATAPTNATLGGAAGNAQVPLTMSGTANGAAITTFTVQRGAAAGGPFSTIGTATPSATPTSGATSAAYTDSTAANGTAYYYQAIANTTAGNTTSAVAGPYTPGASSLTLPAHYLASDASHNSYVGSPTASMGVSDGYIDLAVWVKASSYTAENELFSRWVSSGSTTNDNSLYILRLNSSGQLFLAWYTNGTNTFNSATSGAALSSSAAVTPDANLGIWLRVQANIGTTTVTCSAGSAVASLAPGSIAFSAAVPTSAAVDSNPWALLGSVITGQGSAGISNVTSVIPAFATLSSSNVFNGRAFKAVVRNSAGAVLMNPDFTVLATETTSFSDTAATPNEWTVSAEGVT